MALTNSSLVTYKKLSPNHSGLRNHVVDTISIHCMAAPWSAKTCCDYFANPNAEASSNYTVGYDGSIGLSVEEKNRSWCTSSSPNDNRAITIEVACEAKHPYTVTDKALESLIKLLVDICERNGIKKLLWKGDKSLIGQVTKQNMTVHRWFANKACPGDYLYNKHSYIANEVNKRLGAKTSTTIETTSSKSEVVKVKVTMQKIYKDNTSNSKGQVRTLQRILNGANNGKGYVGKDGKKLTVDGVFGTNTEYAVNTYKKKYNLPANGIVDKDAWDALLCAL